MVFDGKNYNFTSSSNLQNGGSITFKENSVEITLSLTSNGDPSISFTIPGHTIDATISLQSANAKNRNFIGTYEAKVGNLIDTKSTFNITLYNGNQWVGKEKITFSSTILGQVNTGSGTYVESGNKLDITLTQNDPVTFNFVKSGDIYTATQIDGNLTSVIKMEEVVF